MFNKNLFGEVIQHNKEIIQPYEKKLFNDYNSSTFLTFEEGKIIYTSWHIVPGVDRNNNKYKLI